MELEKIKKIAGEKGYKIFENDSKDYNLNIWGFRKNLSSNKFDDLMVVFWKHQGVWIKKEYPITTDPGVYYLRNPIKGTKGTGALVEGQHEGCWQIGKHNGKYDALVQVKPLPFYRDNDKDTLLELDSRTIETGLWGCNIHRSLEKGEAWFIENFSAGCQVFKRGKDFAEFMDLCYHARDNWGNNFTYTLIKEK